MQLKVHTDGGSLNNPGKAASAFLVYNESGQLLHSDQKYIGIASNNVAEYTGLIMAMEYLVEFQKTNPIKKIAFVADSELMVRQVTGIYKVKNIDIKPLFAKVKMLEMTLGVPITYSHVLREYNAQADALVKKALGR